MNWIELYVLNPAWAQVWVTVIGNILLAITIWIGIQATKAATRAAIAAEKGIEIGQRAYLTINPGIDRYWDGTGPKSRVSSFRFGGAATNSGSTPAINVKSDIIVFTLPKDSTTDYKVRHNRVDDMGDIEQGSSIPIAWDYISKDEMINIFEEDIRVFVFIEFTYSDVFVNKNRHYYLRCFEPIVAIHPNEYKRGIDYGKTPFKFIEDSHFSRKIHQKIKLDRKTKILEAKVNEN